MTIQLFANNAKTTLAAPITSTQTSITVTPGTGALFPSPTTGQAFKVTLNSAVSTSVYEICLCTARSGDTMTVVRGQEGTPSQAFLLNDIVGNFDTAAVMADLVQSEQLQTQYYQYAVATGTGNALTATIPSNLTALTDGMYLTVKSVGANTGAMTLNLTLGSTILGVIPVVKGNNQALIGGEVPGAGYPLSLTYSATFGAWLLTDTSVILTAYAPLNSPAFIGTPTAPTPTTSDNSTLIATTAYVKNNLLNYAPLYSPGFSGTPTLAGNALISNNGGTYNISVSGNASSVTNGVYNNGSTYSISISGQAATVGLSQFGNSLVSNGYQKLPTGLILQWGSVHIASPGGSGSVTFPTPFSSAVFSITATAHGALVTYCDYVSSYSTTGFTLVNRDTSGGPFDYFWFAIGV